MDEQQQSQIDSLVASHLRLAYGIAARYKNSGLPLEDLRQEALLGLLAAARNYLPDKGATFSTYAVYWIRKYVLEAILQEDRSSLDASSLDVGQFDVADTSLPETEENTQLSLPSGMPEKEKLVLELSQGQKLTLQEIAQRMQISVERVKQLRSKAIRRLAILTRDNHENLS